ncbi:MAG: mechanosensitive ion channel family protein, partial [Thermoanaerobaculia bacterium]
TAPEMRVAPPRPFPVQLEGEVLFNVSHRSGSFEADERAAAIEKRISDIATRPFGRAPKFKVVENGTSSEIVAGNRIVMTISDADVEGTKLTRQELANRLAERIEVSVANVRARYGLRAVVIDTLLALLISLLLFFLLKLIRFLAPIGIAQIESWRGTKIRSIRIQRLELLSAERFTDFLVGLIALIRGVSIVVLIGAWAAILLSLYPWTRGYTRVLVGYLLLPIRSVWQTAVDYVPNLFFVLVIAVITYYSIKLVHVIFREMGKGTIVFSDFDPEWAEPTFKIARFLILTGAVVVAFPYLPGSSSPAFKGISIFLGVLFSLGSTSAVSNVVAGVVLTYTRAFRLGDRVRIADTVGDVVAKSLLVTRVRTIKNVDITVPNSLVLSSHIVNFSASAQASGLILNTSVTIGYDAPWPRVHELLIAAAKQTPNILVSPEPFVLQTALDDFFVHYEINAYTDQPGRMAVTYSELHARIQDAFSEAGVEIMSPAYTAYRDGTRPAIPAETRVGKPAPRLHPTPHLPPVAAARPRPDSSGESGDSE